MEALNLALLGTLPVENACLDELDGLDEDAADVDGTGIYGTFYIDTLEFAMAATSIREVVNFPEKISVLPLTPDYVIGIFNLRGEILPIIDIAQFLGLSVTPCCNSSSRVVVIDCNTHFVGAVFDTTGEVLKVEENEVKLLQHHPDTPERVVEGLLHLDNGDRLLQVLSAAQIAHVNHIPQCGREFEEEVVEEPLTKLIITEVNGIVLGIELDSVLEVQWDLEIRSTLTYFEHCVGMVNLRGENVPVADLGTILGVPNPEGTPEHRRFLFVHNGVTTCALITERILDVLDVEDRNIIGLPLLSRFQCGQFIPQVIRDCRGRDVLKLDINMLLACLKVKATLPESSGTQLLIAHQEKETAFLEDGGTDEDDLRYLSFRFGVHIMGFDLRRVREVQPFPNDYMHHPGADKTFIGMMNLRGDILPLIDLRTLYAVPSPCPLEECQVVVLVLGEGYCGLLVEELDGIVQGKLRAPAYVQTMLATSSGNPRLNQHVSDILALDKRHRKKTNTIMLLDPDAIVHSLNTCSGDEGGKQQEMVSNAEAPLM